MLVAMFVESTPTTIFVLIKNVMGLLAIILDENVKISIKISLMFVPKGPINYIPALVRIMACRRPGGKPF